MLKLKFLIPGFGCVQNGTGYKKTREKKFFPETIVVPKSDLSVKKQVFSKETSSNLQLTTFNIIDYNEVVSKMLFLRFWLSLDVCGYVYVLKKEVTKEILIDFIRKVSKRFLLMAYEEFTCILCREVPYGR